MKTGAASGIQIAFFTFAFLLLLVPVTDWLLGNRAWSQEALALADRALLFLLGAAILFGIPPLRRVSLNLLREPIPRSARAEVAIVTALKLLAAFATVGAAALWVWWRGGPSALARYAAQWLSDEQELAKAFRLAHVVNAIVVAGVVGPILEEIVFRGMLYRAWERQWGWFASMLLTSTLFAVYHKQAMAAFIGSVIFVCLYRRTGSLWAPIIAHMAGNISLWYPLLGRHVIPRHHEAAGSIEAWAPQLAGLLALALFIPAYVWMARDGRLRGASLFPLSQGDRKAARMDDPASTTCTHGRS